ncbi:hypothetical protein [Marinilactibacillus kalidii]|uniref:hypothetical protein n=1 Tax=Marinilactibacillus kalidii TaxID=2820274 RepID=UPI001ABEE3F8|nr:hypothetical protein [Marinilactibacillus kalidii]
MDKFNLLMICFLIIAFSSICLAYYVYQLILMDAKSRQIDHPRFWSTIAAANQNGGGILLYLFKRRKTTSLLSENEKQTFLTIKKKIYCLLALSFVTFLVSLLILIRY